MAINLKLDLKNLSQSARTVVAIVPAVIIVILALLLAVIPKSKEIKKLNGEILAQQAEIAKNQALAAKLDVLKLENERLQKEFAKLQEQLPEEKEVSSLLKQISDIAYKSEIEILSWKPETKKAHSSGIVEEVPFSLSLSGTYHNLGYFFSNLTKLNRLVNIADIKLGNPKIKKDEAMLDISFKASTFTAVKEGDIKKDAKEAKKK
ncbi:MAG: type 4a pilus biogenesis protein PilO [Nitrospiraceae bacterium]|nr:type 4a pilus biogenesis protein PilO [Nitrospiraceae bacterium]